jgi:hypothetical protein
MGTLRSHLPTGPCPACARTAVRGRPGLEPDTCGEASGCRSVAAAGSAQVAGTLDALGASW